MRQLKVAMGALTPTVKKVDGTVTNLLSAGLPKPMVENGVITNEPPVEAGTDWLVAKGVFDASERTDLVMFDPAKTNYENGRIASQGGYKNRNGESFDF